MRRITTKEIPLYKVTIPEIVEVYGKVYSFLLEMKAQKSSYKISRYKNAIAEPGWAASEIIYLCLYGYTKKNKFTKHKEYIRWNNCPLSLYTRAVASLGKTAKDYFDAQKEEKKHILIDNGIKPTKENIKNTPIDTLSYKFNTNDAEVKRRMQRYIEDFDLNSAIDQDLLKNFVKTQILIEEAQDTLMRGSHTSLDLKALTEQIQKYTVLLGLSKKDRQALGADRKKGSIAELSSIYEETIQDYEDFEMECLVEELDMLLDKFDRRTPDSDRELTAKTFRVLSGGFTIDEARELTGRKRKYAKTK